MATCSIFNRILNRLYKHISCKRNMSSGVGLLSIFERNPKRLERIKFLGNLFEAGGFELRIAGGAVRDILTGKEPLDIDFATTARPEQSLELLKNHEDVIRIIVTVAGQKHGTVAVKFKEVELSAKRFKLDQKKPTEKQINDKPPEYDNEPPYEITTLRCDKLTDGRHAEVEFIDDWSKDAERRDLTINAMFLTLSDGKLIDYFNGKSDLENGIVRFVGDANLRIKEDYLRILRYFRFWSRYGRKNPPDEETVNNIRNNIDGLSQISGERIWQELKKIFSILPCSDVLRLMLELRVFKYTGLSDKSIDDYQEFCQLALSEVKLAESHVKEFNELYHETDVNDFKKLKELQSAVLFSPIIRNSEICLSVTWRMKLSNLERFTVLHIVQNRNQDPSIQVYKKQLALAPLPDRNPTLLKMKAFLIYKGEFAIMKELDSWEIPRFPLSGKVVKDAVKRNKLTGNIIKTSMDSLKNYWADNEFKPTVEELTQKFEEELEKYRAND